MGNSVFHPADYAILSGSVDKDRMGRSFALHTFSGNLGFAAAPPIMALLAVTIGWRASLILVGLLGIPVVVSIVLQSAILNDQVHHEATHAGPTLSGRELLFSRTMLLFFGFFLLGSMAGAGVQSWLITVLHTVKGLTLEVASATLTGYMAGFHHRGAGRRLVRRHLQAACAAVCRGADDSLRGADRFGELGAAVRVGGDGGDVRIRACTGGQPHTTRRDAEGCGAAWPDRQGVRLRQCGSAAGSALTPVPFGFLIDRGHPELILVMVGALLLASLLCVGTARSVARHQAVVAPAE